MHIAKKTATDVQATTGSYTSTTGQKRLHRQYISDPLAAGLAFTTATTLKCYIQTLESNADDNIISMAGLRIVSKDGVTVKATLAAVADYSTATEWNTSIRNKAFFDGDTCAVNYTTLAGDRLVLEVGHSDSSGATISASSRFGFCWWGQWGERDGYRHDARPLVRDLADAGVP